MSNETKPVITLEPIIVSESVHGIPQMCKCGCVIWVADGHPAEWNSRCDSCGQRYLFTFTHEEDVTATLKLALAFIREAEKHLNVWLVDYTDQVFEEQPVVDDARTHLNDAIELLEMKLGYLEKEAPT